VVGKFATMKVGLMIVTQGLWGTGNQGAGRLTGRWTENSFEMDAVDDCVFSLGACPFDHEIFNTPFCSAILTDI
jgi:hypothetical protein